MSVMIHGSKNNMEQFKAYVNGRLARALEYVAGTDFRELTEGEYEIEGRNIFVRVSSYLTEPKEERRMEKHNKYIDVQVVISGRELIGYAPFPSDAIVVEDAAAERDVLFYDYQGEEGLIPMREGDFAVLFPWELHRPNCIWGESCRVKKAVVKVLAE